MLRKAGLACTVCGSRNYTLNLSSVAKENELKLKVLPYLWQTHIAQRNALNRITLIGFEHVELTDLSVNF